MSSDPLVSIVVPVFNVEKYLNECIDSALSQSYQNVEIIAVNDGSTDSSSKILSKYGDKIKVITKENGGIASALNAGIQLASGDWIKWLSADDALYPNAISDLMAESRGLSYQERYIFYGSFDFIDSEGNVFDKQIEPNLNELSDFDFNVALLDHFIGNGTTSLIHKKLIEKYGFFNTDWSHAQDYELWLRYSIQHNCRLRLTPKVVAKYRVHQGQGTRRKLKNSIMQARAVRKDVLGKVDARKRQQYIEALKIYKSKKSIIEKIQYFVRYKLFLIIPEALSVGLIGSYWKIKKLINRKSI